MTEHSDVCVVIPVYNEAAVVGDVVGEVVRRIGRVVCVDDGSHDESASICRAAGAVVVRHPINLGQGAALRTGLEFALSDPAIQSFVTFDSDGQHDVDDVEAMLAVLRRGTAQVIFGSRFLDRRTSMTISKRVVLRLAAAFSRRSSGLELTDAHNGLRVFSRDVALGLQIEMNGMAHASEIVSIVAREGFRYAEAPVHVRYTDYSRAKGQPLMNSVNIIFDLIFR